MEFGKIKAAKRLCQILNFGTMIETCAYNNYTPVKENQKIQRR